MNAKYISIKELYSNFLSVIRNKQVNIADIIEWAIQCETEFIEDYKYYVKYVKIKVPVHGKQARVPYFKTRMLDVYFDPDNTSSHVNYYDNGSYIILDSDYKKDHIYMNFYGLPLDEETNIPMIKRDHAEACVAHIIHQLYREDYLNGKLDQGRWSEIKEERLTQIRAAQSSLEDYDRRDLDRIKVITLNMMPVIRWDSFAHKGIGG